MPTRLITSVLSSKSKAPSYDGLLCVCFCALTFAHRARCAAAILFRATALIRRRAGFAARGGFVFAHLARWAAAILARVAAENLRRLRLGCGGRPAFPRPVESRPSIAAIARSIWSRSAVSSATI
jgi:hypothetical protein